MSDDDVMHDVGADTARRMILLSAGCLGLSFGLTPARTLAADLVVVDVRPLAKAYRASRLIGSAVVNDAKDGIGSIDDLIVTPDRVLFAIISVGGFLGLSGRLVAVPYSSLQIDDEGRRVVLPGATKDQLKNLPPFQYGV